MEIAPAIVATLLATCLMTGFSYIVSAAFSKLYKEPVLLDYSMKRLGWKPGETTRRVAGWVLHLLVGFAFVVSYLVAWRFGLPRTWLSGLLLGAVSGVVGILGWMIIFRLPENPPHVHFKEYYLQLFFAHVIFGVTATAVYIFWP